MGAPFMNMMNSMKCPAGGEPQKEKIMAGGRGKNVFLFFSGAISSFGLIKLHDVHKFYGCLAAFASEPGMERTRPVFNPGNHPLTTKSEYFMSFMKFYVVGRFKRFFGKHYFLRGSQGRRKMCRILVTLGRIYEVRKYVLHVVHKIRVGPLLGAII